jgi:hypothetical protein
MRKEELEEIQNSIVCCPYCKEFFRVASGWFFADNPGAEREPAKFIKGMYVSKLVQKNIKIEDKDS